MDGQCKGLTPSGNTSLLSDGWTCLESFAKIKQMIPHLVDIHVADVESDCVVL